MTDDWDSEAMIGYQYYHQDLLHQLEWATQFVQRNRHHPNVIASEIANLFMLMNHIEHEAHLAVPFMTLVRALGDLPFRLGYWIDWERHLRVALQLADRQGRQDDQVAFLSELSSIFFNTGRLDDSIAVLQTILALPLGAESAQTLASAVSRATSSALLSNRGAIIEQLIEMAKHHPAYHFATGLEGALASATLSFAQAVYWRYQGKFVEALTLFDDGIHILTQYAIENAQLADLYRMRGLTHWYLGDAQQAIQDLRTAEKCFRALNDLPSVGICKGNRGLVYWSIGKLAPAEKVTRDSIRSAKRHNAHLQLVSQVGNLGLVFLSKGWLEVAHRQMNQQIRLAKTYGVYSEQDRGRANRGIVRLHLGFLADAESELLHTVHALEAQHRMVGVGSICTNLARCYARMERTDEALMYARRALDIAEQTRSEVLKVIGLRALAEADVDHPDKHLMEALALSQMFRRRLDEGACYLSLASYYGDDALWRRGRHVLENCDAEAWLYDKSIDNPPFIVTIV